MQPTEDIHELIRLASIKWAKMDGAAALAEEMKKVKFSELVNQYTTGSVVRAEHQSRIHPEYIKAIEEAIVLRTKANILKGKLRSLEVRFETWRTKNATRRAEMNLR